MAVIKYSLSPENLAQLQKKAKNQHMTVQDYITFKLFNSLNLHVLFAHPFSMRKLIGFISHNYLSLSSIVT